ncbi:MAG TPA: hypothetical protein DHW02_03005 [Ktedonobacter sp.]|nr:hypothetical protein [Ktedonobacter sp.]
MQQQVQEPQATVSQPGKRRRIPAKTWRFLLLIAAIIIIVIFVLASLGDFPTIMGMTPLVFAAILSGCVGILSLLVVIIPLIHDDVEPNANTSSSTGSSYSFSGPVNFYQSSPPPQPATTVTPQPANTLPDTPSASTTTEPSMRHTSGSLSFHNEPTVPTNPKTIQQREETVIRIYQELTQPEISSLVLTAIGGQGKSTLAALVFNYVETQRSSNSEPFQEASLWFDVGQDMLFSELANNILYTLGVSIPDFKTLLPHNQALVLFNALDTLEKSRFIVLNQFENLLDWGTGKATTASSGVDDFVDALNSNPCTCHVLLTSRPRPVGTRSQPASCLVEYKVDGLAIAEGMDLLRKQGVSIQQAMDEDLREVVQRCDGHAFALVLLATLLQNPSLTVKALLNNPNYNRKWGAHIAHQLLDDIVNRLTPIQRELLLAFSVYREPVPINAAHAIMSTAYENEQEQFALDALYNQHLLQSPEIPIQQDEPYYQLHAIVVEYAQSHFIIGDKQAEAALHKAHEKAALYYIKIARTNCPVRDKRHHLNEVLPFVEAVRQYNDAEQWQIAYYVMEDEYLFVDLRIWGENVLLLELCQMLILKMPQSTDGKEEHIQLQKRALIYNNLGLVYDNLGNQQKALDYYNQALTTRRSTGDIGGEGIALNNLGHVYADLGDKQQALEYYKNALITIRKVKDRESEGAALNNIGCVYHDLGDKQQALDYYEKSLQLRRATRDQAGEGTTLNNIGRVYDDLEDKQQALTYYKKSLILRKQIGNVSGQGITLVNIGILYLEQDNKDVALAFFILSKFLLVKAQSPYSDKVQGWMDDLRAGMGSDQFYQLFAQIEPHAQQIVDETLSHALPDESD